MQNPPEQTTNDRNRIALRVIIILGTVVSAALLPALWAIAVISAHILHGQPIESPFEGELGWAWGIMFIYAMAYGIWWEHQP